MQSKILAKKKFIIRKKEKILDLTTRSISYKSNGEIIDSFYVGEDMCMRPDLISYAAYSNDDNFDLILKFNGISNPYSIDYGDLILIPDLGFMNDSLENPSNKDENNDVVNQYLKSEDLYSIDPNKLAYDEEMKRIRKNLDNATFSKYNLPPNMAEPGESEARINTDGTIILGAYVTKNS